MSKIGMNDYYVKKKIKILKDFEDRLEIAKKLLLTKFSTIKTDEIISFIKLDFEQLLPKIPYIGGAKNPITIILLNCVSSLAIFRILEKEGYSFEEIGEFYYNYALAIHKARKEVLKKAGRDPSLYVFEPVYRDYQKRLCEETLKRTYPNDWVMEYIEGDSKKFEWGWDVCECGVQKVFKELGAERYLPFICLGDYYEAEGLGYGFKRTETLGFGANKCTHRFVKNYKTPKAWPPYGLDEFNKDYWNK